MSHQNTVQPTRCIPERGPEVFPQLSSKYHKTETPCSHSSVQRVGMHTFGYKLSYVLPLKYIWKWIFLTKMVNCSKLHIYRIATIAYFLRFLTLFFVYVIIITKSMYHICTTAAVIRLRKKARIKKQISILMFCQVRSKRSSKHFC